jgi:hypothetical protein
MYIMRRVTKMRIRYNILVWKPKGTSFHILKSSSFSFVYLVCLSLFLVFYSRAKRPYCTYQVQPQDSHSHSTTFAIRYRCQPEDVPRQCTFSAIITVEKLAPHDWPCWKVKVSCDQRPEPNTLPNAPESLAGYAYTLLSPLINYGWRNSEAMSRDELRSGPPGFALCQDVDVFRRNKNCRYAC